MATRDRVWRVLLLNAALAAGYAALGTLALAVVGGTGLSAPIWPAAGLAFAMVLICGWRVAPGVAVGSVLVNVPALLADESGALTAWSVPIMIALGATLQAMAGAALVRRYVGPRPSLVLARDIVLFLALAGPVACVVNPTVGTIAQLAGGVVDPEQGLFAWTTWWVGDSIGVVVAAPLLFMVLPQTRDAWRGRRFSVAVPLFLLLAGTTWLFVQNAYVDRAEQQSLLRQRAVEARTVLQTEIGQREETLEGIRGLFNASDEVRRDEFATFTRQTLAQELAVQALAWDVAVSDADLASLQARMRREQGRPDFIVTERGPDGTLVPASSRPLHVVVDYIEPPGENSAGIGFDIMSNPDRAEAAMDAMTSGDVRATAAVNLVVDQRNQSGMLLLLPVYSGGGVPETAAERESSLRGFAVGAYLWGDLLAASFADPTWDGYTIRVTDVSDAADPRVLAQRDAGTPITTMSPLTETLDVAGRTWQLTVIPTTTATDLLPPSYSLGVLLTGLLGVLLLEALLLILTGTERLARRAAEIHGYEANHDPLTDLYNRRAFIDLLEKARMRAEIEASRHVLLFMDLDGFKAVNDTSGHEAGDALLREVANELRMRIRERDVVARIGGDEFACILSNCPVGRGTEIAESLVRGVEQARPARFPGIPTISMSVGLTMIDGAVPATIDELLRQADEACYDAKESGRGQVRVSRSALIN